MLVFNEIKPFRAYMHSQRAGGRSIGLVPTMGALHEGHLSLLKSCKEQNDIVVCSVFVNPAQFNNQDDLKNYPRDLARDVSLLEAAGCDVIFAPSEKEIYPTVPILTFDFGPVATRLEGRFRPGHFNGVGLIVSKLFNLIQPDNAYFGQKDLQQYVIISQLVNDLSFPVSLHCEPIVREESGLALSSRNKRLSTIEKQRAACLYGSLMKGKNAIMHGTEPVADIVESMMTWLREQEVVPEYFEVVDATDLSPVSDTAIPRSIAICVAAYVGEVRLIDNIIFEKE